MSKRPEERLTTEQRALYEFMSDISQECYCAGWMGGNEFRLWSALADPEDKRQYGMGEISADDIAKLRELHEACGGWIEWRDDSHGLPLSEWGAYFIPTEAWVHKVNSLADAAKSIQP